MTILSAGISSTRRSVDVDQVTVGDLLPVRGRRRTVRWPAPRRRDGATPTSVSPHVVASSREPLAARMFSRALGSAVPTSTMVSPSRSRPRSKISAASRALSTVDSAAGDVGRTARSTTPLCDSSHRPSVNGADADGSMGMPTVADRTAATTHPLLQRRRHRCERRVTPQRRGATPPARYVAGAIPRVAPLLPAGAIPESLRSCPRGRRSPRPSRRRSSGHASAVAANTTARAGRAADRGPSDATETGCAEPPKCLHIRRPRPVAHRRRSDAGSGGPSCGSSAARSRARRPRSRREGSCSHRRRTVASTARRASA